MEERIYSRCEGSGEDNMERKEEKKRIVRLGLIYSVEQQRFGIVYKDLVTNQICTRFSDDQEDEETRVSISAA